MTSTRGGQSKSILKVHALCAICFIHYKFRLTAFGAICDEILKFRLKIYGILVKILSPKFRVKALRKCQI